MEWQDIYDQNRRKTGRLHCRGQQLQPGDYVLTVCVWVTDGAGRLLLTKRAAEKRVCPNTWENSGGGAQQGETSRQAVARELREETGICLPEEAFLFLETDRMENTFLDFYVVIHPERPGEIVLQPGETSDYRWVTWEEIHRLMENNQLASPVARRFRLQEKQLAAYCGVSL